MYDKYDYCPKWLVDKFAGGEASLEDLRPAEKKLVYKYPFAANIANKTAKFAESTTISMFGYNRDEI